MAPSAHSDCAEGRRRLWPLLSVFSFPPRPVPQPNSSTRPSVACPTDGANRSTGADILAPSIGNLHGSYKFVKGGPQFRQPILQDLQARFAGRVPYLCLHGTDEISDDLFRECIRNGVTKVNVNSWLRDPYCAALSKGLASKTMPEAIDDAMAAFEKECERFCDLLGSSGKADA